MLGHREVGRVVPWGFGNVGAAIIHYVIWQDVSDVSSGLTTPVHRTDNHLSQAYGTSGVLSRLELIPWESCPRSPGQPTRSYCRAAFQSFSGLLHFQMGI